MRLQTIDNRHVSSVCIVICFAEKSANFRITLRFPKLSGKRVSARNSNGSVLSGAVFIPILDVSPLFS